jgi:CubicO group peptidase (beta-lactamase class C family)
MTRRFFVLLLAAAAWGQKLTPPPEAAARVKQIFSRFDSTTSPGCAVGVSLNDEPVLTGAYGMADLEHDIAIRPETVFEAGSVSKQFTAMAVLLLVKDGKLSLDDNVRKYIPELPDYGTPITIRHLLNHTSGLRDWGSLEAIAGWPRTTRAYTHDHVLEILSRQKALNYTPGAEYSYTNSGYNLAAILVTRVSGMPFAQFTKERIFQPLGMTSTQWRDDFRRVVKNRAIAYMQSGRDFRQLMPFEDVHGNGGLLTTIGDLLKWNANFQTAKVGGKDTVALQQIQSKLNDGRTISYALGLFVEGDEIAHSGTTAGYNAWLGRYPKQQLSVAVLCNASTANGTRLGRSVANILLGREDPFAPELAPGGSHLKWAPTPEQLVSYAGTYTSDEIETTLRVAVENERLVIRRRPNDVIVLNPSDRPGDRGAFTSSLGTVRFFPSELSIHESRVWDLRFQRR